MSISLQKGQKVSLSKDGKNLTKVVVGLGWDASVKGHPIDCDASAIMLVHGRFVDNSDLVYFRHRKHASGSVLHMGDNRTGHGEGDDEQIKIDLRAVPGKYDRIVIVVNIFGADYKHQHFGMIDNAFVRIVDDKGVELCRYDLSENYDGMLAMIFGELYRRDGEWKFNAIGQGTDDANIRRLTERYV